MALLFLESFDSGDQSRYISGSYTRATATPRFSGAAYGGNVSTMRKLASAVSEVYAGVALYAPGTALTNISLWGDSAVTQHLTIQRNASGNIEVRRGNTGGTLLATGTTTIAASSWFHVQVRATIADSGGVVQVRLNGATTNDIDFTGDTKNGGTNSTIDGVKIDTQGGGSWSAADWYISDTTGSVNTSWLGDCRAVSLLPTGNGNTSDGTNSGGNSTNNYTYVDDAPFLSTDYVGVTTSGNGDTYAMADVPAATTSVKGIQTTLYAAKSDSGAKSIKPRIRSGGTTYAGSATALSTSYVSYQEIRESDPATSAAWTTSGVNAIEAGFEAA